MILISKKDISIPFNDGSLVTGSFPLDDGAVITGINATSTDTIYCKVHRPTTYAFSFFT